MIGLSVSFLGRELQWWAGNEEGPCGAGIAMDAERFGMRVGFYPICIARG
jgi:hypothetical protein